MADPLQNLDDYSPSATLIPFDSPIPLLRVPIKASPLDDPTIGPYLLAFKNPQSFATAYKSCGTQIIQQCEAGARIGCSISASDKCKTPWWKIALGISKEDFAERAKCEDREMEGCFVAAKEQCLKFSKQKCLPAFREARVEVDGFFPELINWKEVGKLIGWVCSDTKITTSIELPEAVKTVVRLRNHLEVTNCRGKDLMDSKFLF